MSLLWVVPAAAELRGIVMKIKALAKGRVAGDIIKVMVGSV
jgi:hypothetical protein